MRFSIKFIIFILAVALLSGCAISSGEDFKKENKSYYMKDGKLMYYCMDRLNSCIEGEVVGVDFNSFQVIGGGGNYYAKDKKNVYFKGIKINNANPKSFELFDYEWSFHNYAKDKDYVFFYSKNFNVLVEADVSSFKFLNAVFTKDKNTVFAWGVEIEGADSSSFEVINNEGHKNYAKDKNNVYIDYKKIVDADPNSFELLYISEGPINRRDVYSKDKNNIYYILNRGDIRIVTGGDVDTFVVLASNYAKDHAKVYYYGKILFKADSKTFQVLDASYDIATDKNYVFVRDKLEDGVSPVNFEPW